MTTWPRILGLTPGEFTWIAVGVVLLAYELFAVWTRRADVLTRAMRANLPRWTSIAFGLGLLLGHLVGPTWPAFAYAWAIPFVILGALLARDLIKRTRVESEFVMPIFLIGFIAGLFWVGRP